MNDTDRAARDAAIRAILPLVPQGGWTRQTIAAAGLPEDRAAILFPRGGASAIEAWAELTDRDMADAAGDLSGLRTPARIRALVAARLALLAPHKDAARRAVAVLALPWKAASAIRIAAGTADAVWRAAGDTSDDLSRYTRRATFAAIHAATMAFWLRDDDQDTGRALAFLDRRLAGLARFQRCRKPSAPAKAA